MNPTKEIRPANSAQAATKRRSATLVKGEGEGLSGADMPLGPRSSFNPSIVPPEFQNLVARFSR
jgi:hypothetical protein